VTAVFVSNIPQGVAGASALKAAGYTDRPIFNMWTGLTLAAAGSAGLGYLLPDSAHLTGIYAEAFAAGAVLTMLANSMMPEAFAHPVRRSPPARHRAHECDFGRSDHPDVAGYRAGTGALRGWRSRLAWVTGLAVAGRAVTRRSGA
jgi:zinc transporter ZupT